MGDGGGCGEIACWQAAVRRGKRAGAPLPAT